MNCFCEEAPFADTLTVKVALPAACGVPLSMPFDESERPLGKEPDRMLQVLLPAPEAANEVEYELPTLASGRVAVVVVGATAPGAGGGGLPPGR